MAGGIGPTIIHMILTPWAWLLIVPLSLLGVAGNLTLYKLGKQGFETVASRFPLVTPARWHRAEEMFKAQGTWILLLSSLPGLGILLSTAAGAFDIKLHKFILWVMVAKMTRNWLLLIAAVYFSRLVIE